MLGGKRGAERREREEDCFREKRGWEMKRKGRRGMLRWRMEAWEMTGGMLKRRMEDWR